MRYPVAGCYCMKISVSVPGPNGSLVPFSDTYSTDDFRDEMIRNCVTYVIIGVIIFAAAFTQVSHNKLPTF